MVKILSHFKNSENRKNTFHGTEMDHAKNIFSLFYFYIRLR